MAAVVRTFILKCSQCKEEHEYPYDEKESNQNIMRYPREGTCRDCGDTVFNACITAIVKEVLRDPYCAGCNEEQKEPGTWRSSQCPLCNPYVYPESAQKMWRDKFAGSMK